MTVTELYSIFTAHPSVTTDSRKVTAGDLFFALTGPNFDGNQFVDQALEQGAAYCVCSDLARIDDGRIINVENVLSALQDLAKYHRQQFNIPFLAITGSNGKTTTKELIHAVLSKTMTCYTTKGNLNNHIGIPLTLLAIKRDAEIAVVEMGANHLHEIEDYCTYTLPTHGLITNCGKAHLEGFGSEAGVRKGKGELYDFIANANGTVFINTDYPYLNEMSRAVINKVSYGSESGTFKGGVTGNGTFIEVSVTAGADIPLIRTQLTGNYNLPNILSAVAVGKSFGVGDDDIKQALEAYEPTNSRSQMIHKGSNRILLDAYNANPTSMQAAIENFAAMPGSKKVLLLGGMKELGADSVREHRALIELLQQFKWERVAVTGDDFTDLPDGIHYFPTTADMKEWLKQEHFEDTFMLIKGSRGMAMEQLLA